MDSCTMMKIFVAMPVLTELITELFYSWRSYNLILKRLREVHGIRRRHCFTQWYKIIP